MVREKITCKRDKSAQLAVQEWLLPFFQLFLYGIYEMSATFKPTVCILGGDNIKLHKYMPNTRETATSNAAVIKLIIKAENKGAG